MESRTFRWSRLLAETTDSSATIGGAADANGRAPLVGSVACATGDGFEHADVLLVGGARAGEEGSPWLGVEAFSSVAPFAPVPTDSDGSVANRLGHGAVIVAPARTEADDDAASEAPAAPAVSAAPALVVFGGELVAPGTSEDRARLGDLHVGSVASVPQQPARSLGVLWRERAPAMCALLPRPRQQRQEMAAGDGDGSEEDNGSSGEEEELGAGSRSNSFASRPATPAGLEPWPAPRSWHSCTAVVAALPDAVILGACPPPLPSAADTAGGDEQEWEGDGSRRPSAAAARRKLSSRPGSAASALSDAAPAEPPFVPSRAARQALQRLPGGGEGTLVGMMLMCGGQGEGGSALGDVWAFVPACNAYVPPPPPSVASTDDEEEEDSAGESSQEDEGEADDSEAGSEGGGEGGGEGGSEAGAPTPQPRGAIGTGDCWVALCPAGRSPLPRQGHSCVLLPALREGSCGSLALLGGVGAGADGGGAESLSLLSLDTWSWSDVATTGGPRSLTWHGAAALRTRDDGWHLLVFGGVGAPSGEGEGGCRALDPDSGRWSRASELLTAPAAVDAEGRAGAVPNRVRGADEPLAPPHCVGHSVAASCSGGVAIVYGGRAGYSHALHLCNPGEGGADEGDALMGQGRHQMAGGAVYVGGWFRGAPHGRGVLEDEGGAVTEGTWVRGVLQGHGRRVFHRQDGAAAGEAAEAVYDGEWAGGAQDGQGVCEYADGATYAGEWRAGLREGEGEWRRSAAAAGGAAQEPAAQGMPPVVFSPAAAAARLLNYTGAWQAGEPHGEGRAVYALGPAWRIAFSGTWRAGKAQGEGRWRLEDGGGRAVAASYEGAFDAGLRHGQGEARTSARVVFKTQSALAAEEVYDGEWARGLRCGRGRMTAANGDVYEGSWRNGRLNGTCKVYDAKTREVFEGKLVGGRRCGQGRSRWPSGQSYDGVWQDGAFNGRGTCRYAAPLPDASNPAAAVLRVPRACCAAPDDLGTAPMVVVERRAGDVYEGEWQRGQPHGIGEYRRASGEVVVCALWRRGAAIKAPADESDGAAANEDGGGGGGDAEEGKWQDEDEGRTSPLGVAIPDAEEGAAPSVYGMLTDVSVASVEVVVGLNSSCVRGDGGEEKMMEMPSTDTTGWSIDMRA